MDNGQTQALDITYMVLYDRFGEQVAQKTLDPSVLLVAGDTFTLTWNIEVVDDSGALAAITV